MRPELHIALLLFAVAACSEKRPAATGEEDKAAPKAAAGSAIEPALPETSAPVSAPKSEAYREALQEGRELMKEGEYPAARKAFEKALNAEPGDARAFSELAWAAFHTGDLSAALKNSDSAVAASGDPKLKAASLYTLGRIHEKQGAHDKARQAYQESLALRPRKSVELRLASLEGGVVRAPEPALGPYANLKEFCQLSSNSSVLARRFPARLECDARPRLNLDAPLSPWQDAHLFALSVRDSEGEAVSVALQLAMKTEGKWFVFLDAIDVDELAASRALLDSAGLSLRDGALLLVYPGSEGPAELQCEVQPETKRPSCTR